MTIKHRLFSILLFGALAAGLVQADARDRRHAHGARHVGQPRPAVGAAATARPNGFGASYAVKPAPLVVPGPPGRNAIGVATKPALAGVTATGRVSGTGSIGGGKGNAIGTHAGPAIIAPAAPSALARVAPGGVRANAVRSAAPTVPAYAGTISGTGMTHRGFAPASIGGPAKLAAGISGTGLKPKR